MPFDDNLVSTIIDKLKNDYNLSEIDYSFYIKKKEERIYKCKNCDKEKSTKVDLCNICKGLSNRKVKNRPSIEELIEEVKKLGYRGTGNKYGVSDTAVKKWLGDSALKFNKRYDEKLKCIDCNIEIGYNKKRCFKCFKIKNTKKPKDLKDLKNEFNKNGIQWCVDKYQVGRTAIYRWLKNI
jgi:DNA invertase Pin-like site-specific DNA recombinase